MKEIKKYQLKCEKTETTKIYTVESLFAANIIARDFINKGEWDKVTVIEKATGKVTDEYERGE